MLSASRSVDAISERAHAHITSTNDGDGAEDRHTRPVLSLHRGPLSCLVGVIEIFRHVSIQVRGSCASVAVSVNPLCRIAFTFSIALVVLGVYGAFMFSTHGVVGPSTAGR